MTETFIERLNRREDILKAMLDMPEDANKQMAEQRRIENFSFLWEETDMTREEVISNVKDREAQFIDKYDDMGLPEWLLRCEAQDVVLEAMHAKFQEEGLL